MKKHLSRYHWYRQIGYWPVPSLCLVVRNWSKP